MKCIIAKITNLQTEVYDDSNKKFQIFEAAGYKLVTGYHYIDGELGVVIPAGAVVPDQLLKDMWLYGKLAGAKRNRVVSKKMFGYPSEAIFYGKRYFNEFGEFIDSPAWKDHWQ